MVGISLSHIFIQRIENADGEVIFTAEPKVACPECTDIPVIYGDTTRALLHYL